jgi:hypothetical protein
LSGIRTSGIFNYSLPLGFFQIQLSDI